MPTDKALLVKGLRRLMLTLLLLFTGPILLYEAFKNEGHPFYIPVLVLGGLVSLGAIAMGFRGIRTLIRALFAPPPKNGGPDA